MSSTIPPSLVEEGVDLLQALIRCDTSNPPGNEAKAVSILEQLLHEDGIPFERIEPERGRANLIARLPGDGTEEPLLLSSHLDVVPASEEGWTHPPFSGVNADGYIWGRGAIDMKGFAAMAFTLFRQAKREHRRRKRDLIFAAVADEERGCQWGSSYLVEHHPDLVTAEYAINEVGGFSIDVRGQPFFLIQRAERGVAWIRVRFRGKPGHSSLPTPHSALQQAAKAITQLSGAKLPHHPNAPALDFLDAVGAASSPIERMVLRSLHSPALGKWVLHHLFPPGEQRLNTQASLSNSMTPTVIHAGNAVNVVPSEVTMDIDGRIVPGSSLDELLHELRTIIGPDPQVEILAHHPPSVFPTETPMYRVMEEVIHARRPDARVAPYLISGFTDSWNWAKLGTTCYGFYPLELPPDLRFSELFHGIDERIPISGFEFGLACISDLFERELYAEP